MEVVKTRMQLQGELVLRSSLSEPGHHMTKVYRNAPHAFYKICRDEGLRGIQAGLVPGLLYQVRHAASASSWYVLSTPFHASPSRSVAFRISQQVFLLTTEVPGPAVVKTANIDERLQFTMGCVFLCGKMDGSRMV